MTERMSLPTAGVKDWGWQASIVPTLRRMGRSGFRAMGELHVSMG